MVLKEASDSFDITDHGETEKLFTSPYILAAIVSKNESVSYINLKQVCMWSHQWNSKQWNNKTLETSCSQIMNGYIMSGPQGLEYPYVRFYFTYLKSLSTSISTVISARHFPSGRFGIELLAFLFLST